MAASETSDTQSVLGRSAGGHDPAGSGAARLGSADRGPADPVAPGEALLTTLLDGMDAALCAFDAEGHVTHWNREAQRLLGWSPREAVGRRGLTGWAARPGDADEVNARLRSAMRSPGRRVDEFALVTKEGGRLLVRAQSAGVRNAAGEHAGVYFAFTEVRARIDLERSVALGEALLGDASHGVVIVDADLRLTVVNDRATRSLRRGRSTLLGRLLGDVLSAGVEELEAALRHVLAVGESPAPADTWVTLRDSGEVSLTENSGGRPSPRRCLRGGFVRMTSPMDERPLPLGVVWVFQDVTESKLLERRADRVRFRETQLRRAVRAAAECESPMEAAALHLDFSLPGFADHALLDLESGGQLVRAVSSPRMGPGGDTSPLGGGRPLPYVEDHPAARCLDRDTVVRSSIGGGDVAAWAARRSWPAGTVHGLCAVLRSRGLAHGVVTFLRNASRPPFDRMDVEYAEDVAARLASAVDLAGVRAERH